MDDSSSRLDSLVSVVAAYRCWTISVSARVRRLNRTCAKASCMCVRYELVCLVVSFR
jgi:hypothetical protein